MNRWGCRIAAVILLLALFILLFGLQRTLQRMAAERPAATQQ
jgi:hypothetical protein